MTNKIDLSKIVAKKQLDGFLAFSLDSEKIIESICYWVPPTPAWKPLRKKPNSSLRFACLVEDRLYHGLRYEGELMLLTPQNWKQILKYGKPDMLIMESTWGTSTGHWLMGQSIPSTERKELIKIISMAQKMSIPTVYWITKGFEYHEHYKDFATYFDYIFCADPKEAEMLRIEGVKAEVLLPCVQPALYNPFRIFDHYDDFSLEVLFDGWGDLDHYQDKLTVISKIKDYGLSIIDSHNLIFKNRKNYLFEYKNNILGCVTAISRLMILKYTDLCITFDHSRLTQTERNWKAIETSACRVPQVHHGKIEEDDIRKEIFIERSNEMEFIAEIDRLKKDKNYRICMAHKSWRNVLLHHTYAHRIQTICGKIQIKHDWDEYPAITMITPTCRRTFAPLILDNFRKQNYPNKELIIAFNGNEAFIKKKAKQNENVRIYNIPTDQFTGGCMNFGINAAKGVYSFKVDDDDYYGENYILDMILHTRSVDMDLFGKPLSRYFHFESDDRVCGSINIRGKSLSIVPWQHSSFSTPEWFTGNSISGKTDVFKKFRYKTNGYRCSDTSFFLNADMQNSVVVIVDDLNMVVERRSDVSTHTWQISEQTLKDRSKVHNYSLNDLMI